VKVEDANCRQKRVRGEVWGEVRTIPQNWHKIYALTFNKIQIAGNANQKKIFLKLNHKYCDLKLFTEIEKAKE
jgi:hypothetical protein